MKEVKMKMTCSAALERCNTMFISYVKW